MKSGNYSISVVFICSLLLCSTLMARANVVLLERYPIEFCKKNIDNPPSEIFVGTASSMVKILPEKLDRAIIKKVSEIRISLFSAKNESEASQIVLYSPKKELKNVIIIPSNLVSDKGDIISIDAITAVPLGFVKTTEPKYYESSYIGWWPDPIMTNIKSFDVKKGIYQSIWYSVRVDKDMKAGKYKGKVTISIDGVSDIDIPVELQVWDFVLPERDSLKTAAATREDQFYAGKTPEELREIQKRYDIFLDKHRCSPGWGIYRPSGKPIPEWRIKLWSELDVSAFCIARFRHEDALKCSESVPKSLQECIHYEIVYAHNRAEKYGITDRSFVYLCDEVREKHFPGLNNASAEVERQFPGILTLSTAIDPSFGEETCLKDLKAHCSSVGRYDLEKAKIARSKGRQVWWYFCAGNYPPEANIFIESPAIDIRIFLGFQSFAFQVDGFLYWGMLFKNPENPDVLPAKIYTGWNAETIKGWNGDGYVIYPGVDGPLSSIRMENWLDGMEDYEYLTMLNNLLEKVKQDGLENEKTRKIARWFKNFKKPRNRVVYSIHKRTFNPTVIQNNRKKIADAIIYLQSILSSDSL